MKNTIIYHTIQETIQSHANSPPYFKPASDAAEPQSTGIDGSGQASQKIQKRKLGYSLTRCYAFSKNKDLL